MANQTTPAIQVKDSNVGIGTTSPAEKLQVAGNATVHPGQKFGWIYNPGTDNNMYNFIQTAADGSGVAASALEISGSRWTNGNTAGVIFTHQTGGQIMTIMTGGNVGIGATAPVSKLQVNHSAEPSFNPNGGSNALTLIKTTGSGAPGTFGAGLVFSQPYFTNDAAIGVGGIYGVKSAGDGAFGGGIAFFTQPSGAGNMFEVFRYIDNGNVGIGTTSPTAKLQVVLPANTTSSIFQSTASEALLNIQTFPTTNRMQLLVGDYNGTSTPNIAAISDSNTGIQWAGSDILRFVNGGSENVTINASGNVGIGTTSPNSKLDVRGVIEGGDGTIRTVVSYTGSGGVTGTITNHPYILYANNDERMRITSAGNVGIGTTSPSYKFTVNESATDPIAYFGLGPTNASSRNSLIILQSGTIPQSGSDTTGEAGFLFKHSYGTGGVNGTANGGYIESIRESVFGITSQVNTALVFGTSSANTDGERMRITSAGNVGIGTTSPGTKLEVNGGSILIKSTSNQTINLYNNGTVAANIGGTLQFSGTYRNSDFDYVVYASIFGGKENATNGNYAGYMSFSTYTHAGSFSERMRITSTGNVGIGTTSPTAKLDVIGTVRILAADAPTSSELTAKILAYSPAPYGMVFRAYGTGTNSIQVQRESNDSEMFALTLQPNGGNVGIGTTSPDAKLVVVGSGTGVVKIGDAGFGSGNYTGISLNGTLSTSNYNILSSPTDSTLYINRPTGATIQFRENNTTQVIIAASGNVGIGTTSPAANLHIQGSNAKIRLTGDTHTSIELEDGGTGDPGYLKTYYYGSLVAQVGAGGTFFNTGNVGIGTASPAGTLDIGKNDATPSLVIGNSGYGANYNSVWGLQSGAQSIMIFGNNGQNEIRAGNTGVGGYLDFYTNNTASFTTASNGNFVMRLSSGGNVGIGTTSPDTPLFVQGGPAGTGSWNRTATLSATYPGLIFNSNGTKWGGMAYDYSAAMRFWVNANNNDIFAGTLALSILNNGNVGIGTASPDYKLQISDTAANGRAIQAVQTATSGTNYGGVIAAEGSGATQNVGLYVNAIGATTNYAAIFANGNVGIGTTSPGSKLDIDRDGRTGSHATSQSLYVTGTMGGGTTGGQSGNIEFRHSNGSQGIGFGYQTIYQTGDNTNEVLNILSRGTGALTLNAYAYSSGNVGVGTVSPSEKLHISGNVVVDYNSSYQGINSIGNKAILARVSPTTGIINYAEYATATNLNGFVLGSDDARVKGDIATDSLDFITNTSSRMFINSSGNVGIATTSPSYKLDVVGDSRITSGSLGVGVAPNATDGRIDASNDIVAYSTSDQRLKENVTPIENALEKVKTLTGVEFDWKEETAHVHGYHGHDVGIIAQDVQAVLPEAVRTNESGYLSVRYEKMIALLIEANKELAARVEILEQKLKQ